MVEANEALHANLVATTGSPNRNGYRVDSPYSLEDIKFRGGYYTPGSAASMVAHWAVTHDNAHVLEPSAGDGVFVTAVSEQLGVGGGAF